MSHVAILIRKSRAGWLIMERKTIHIQNELHKIQDRFGYLPESALKGLAARAQSQGTPVSLHQIHEVASFYPHYRLKPPEGIEVKVCRDMTCHLLGSQACRAHLEAVAKEIGSKKVTVSGVSCLGRCDKPPAVIIHDHIYDGMTNDEYESLVRKAVEGALPSPPKPAPRTDRWLMNCYHEVSDKELHYAAVRDMTATPELTRLEPLKAKDWKELLKTLKAANLRGMGGAGQPAFEKWQSVLDATDPEGRNEKYVVCNADESEPGTFKDRELLLHTPHLVLEGVIVAGLLLNAWKGYIYIRHEYHDQIEAMQHEIERATRLGACGQNIFGSGRSFPVEVYISPGGYVCGEQSALIEAMEDKRSEPRNKPPELGTNGLWDKPTLLSNVETFAWVPSILINGAKWYSDLGLNNSKGMRFFSISGHVKNPGVYEVPIGLTLGELIEKAGGLLDGMTLKAVATSGPSGGFQPPQIPEPKPQEGGPKERDLVSLPLDIDFFRNYSTALGGGIVVYGHGTDMLSQAVCSTEFFKNESCGKCVPCRQGSKQLVTLGHQIAEKKADSERLTEIKEWVDEINSALELTSICGLGVSAAKPLATTLRFFKADIDRYATNGPDAARQEPAK